MKKKLIYGTSIVFVMFFIFFWLKTVSENNRQTDLPIHTADIDVPESEPDVSEAADEMSAYYGHYRITKFCFTQYYSAVKYDCLPDQEADLLLGRIVVLEPDLLVTYDSERSLGTRGGRDAFDGNYAIETYQIAHPQYSWMSFDTDLGELWWLEPDFDMDWAVEDTYFDQLNGIITIPQLCEPYGTQYYYTMEDSDDLILFSSLTAQYFLLERCGESPEQALPELTEQEKEELLAEVYGEYQVTEFLPTKFYPALDSAGCKILPEEEAELMLGQYITLSEELFVTYDNCRLPNSVIVQRPEDEYRLEKIEIQEPEYRMERRRYDDIYGIRDDMLPDELCRQEYVEIDVYPGYEVSTSRVLPQLFLMEDGRILMYSMGEYFLLEKQEPFSRGASNSDIHYIPELGYRDTMMGHVETYNDYVCWEDILIIRGVLYKKEDGSYRKSDTDLQEFFGYEGDYYVLRQYYQWAITYMEDKGFMVFDLDTLKKDLYLCEENVKISKLIWYIYDGRIYYIQIADYESIHTINLSDGKDEELYRLAEPRDTLWIRDFRIRDDGDLVLEVRDENKVSCEYRLVSFEDGQVTEKKLFEPTIMYRYEYWIDFNQNGLFILGQFPFVQDGRLIELVCLREDGEKEDFNVASEAPFYLTDQRYYQWDSIENPEMVDAVSYEGRYWVDAISEYDFEGKKIGTYRLIDESMLEEGYYLCEMICNGNEIIAFYANDADDELYISQIEGKGGGMIADGTEGETSGSNLRVLFEQTLYPWEAADPSEKSWGLTFDMETGDLLRTEE